ncbi:hypothetical protein, partial [Streptomyces sp. WELS2]|uniref:hypothetical protein n=1 Tax=Streptomyces sp. WELS2 TaxID=2749435 RepID=UPI00215D756E
MCANVPAEPDRPVPDPAALRPLSARSVVLSLLLGAHPPELPVRDLVRLVEPFGIGGSTLRAALSRMVTAGDLRRTDAVYRLSDRLLERQRRQDDAVRPRTRAWHGDWEMVVITATGRGPAERADLRARLTALRLAELREGVWLRPANLDRPLPAEVHRVALTYTARPDEPPVSAVRTRRSRFSVSVPVLSKQMVSMRPSASSVRGVRTRTPPRLSRRAAASWATVATSGSP